MNSLKCGAGRGESVLLHTHSEEWPGEQALHWVLGALEFSSQHKLRKLALTRLEMYEFGTSARSI